MQVKTHTESPKHGMSAKKQKYYVVWSGKTPGVYSSWEECEKQVKGVEGARYKSFDTTAAAQQAFDDGADIHLSPGIRRVVEKKNIALLPADQQPRYPSLSVDGACSGNPGMMEYRGVDSATGREIFHFGPVGGGTNNIGEFLALVHVLALLQQEAQRRPSEAKELLAMPVYSDSRTAQAWLKKGHCATKLQQDEGNKELFRIIQRAENWLATHTYTNPVLKWQTELWGEIPADFGRK